MATKAGGVKRAARKRRERKNIERGAAHIRAVAEKVGVTFA